MYVRVLLLVICSALFSQAVKDTDETPRKNPFIRKLPLKPHYEQRLLPDISDLNLRDASVKVRKYIKDRDIISITLLGYAMLKDCALDSSSSEESMRDCKWSLLLTNISDWVGRKLQSEVDEKQPDADDLEEKLDWLRSHDVVDLLRATAPSLLHSAETQLQDPHRSGHPAAGRSITKCPRDIPPRLVPLLSF
jgi:hypothetical protein